MTDANNARLEVRDLRREFPTPAGPLVVLDKIDFELGPGQSLAVMGPSGSGKSTLLHILGTLDRPTFGGFTLGGVQPFALADDELARFRNERIGFVFQDHHLLPQCSTLENILIPTLVRKDVDVAAAERRARNLLERVGLSDRLDHRPAELSGGERQRAAVARALINEPELLLCDEPTGNLDEAASDAIGELFAQLQTEEQTMLVVVTHNERFAEKFDRCRRLQNGALVENSAS